MFVVDKRKDEILSLPAKEVKAGQLKVASSNLARRILEELAKKPTYPKELARILKVNEQKIYYHVRNLEKERIIEVSETEIIQGAQANVYKLLQPALVVKFKDFEATSRITGVEEGHSSFFEPFVDDGELKATIIVGSPDPHGPEKARSRDGYYGIDFALFLGTFLNYVHGLNVKLDTEVRNDDLKNNLILIGGPVINTVTGKINDEMPIRFQKENNWRIYSTVSKKTYTADETGVIVKMKNPFNTKKFILLIAGKRVMGTRAVMIAFLKKFNEIIKGNKFDNSIMAKVVEGVDLDSDGIVDDVEVLE